MTAFRVRRGMTKRCALPSGWNVSLPPYAGTVLRLDRLQPRPRPACMRRETPRRPEHEPDMDRPPTPDETRTAALDERPTPRRNRRPRFASGHSAATTPEFEPPER